MLFSSASGRPFVRIMASYVRKEKFYKRSTEYEVTYLLCWSACRIDKPDEYRLYQDLSVCWFSWCDAGPIYVNSQPQQRSNSTSPIKTRCKRQRNQLLYHSVSGFYCILAEPSSVQATFCADVWDYIVITTKSKWLYNRKRATKAILFDQGY